MTNQKLPKTYTSINTTTTVIDSFSIDGIYSVPFKLSATVYITLISTENKSFQRNITITNDDYIAWTTDDFLNDYVSDRIEKIYNSQ